MSTNTARQPGQYTFCLDPHTRHKHTQRYMEIIKFNFAFKHTFSVVLPRISKDIGDVSYSEEICGVECFGVSKGCTILSSSFCVHNVDILN